MNLPTSRLTIRPGVDTKHGYVAVRLLIDGEEVLAVGGRRDYMGYEPLQVLVEPSPLLAVEPPRRIGLYRCSCSWGACGNITAVIAEDPDGQIRWTDFREVAASFDDPIDEEVDGDDPWYPIDRADLVFDKDQYRAEIAAATEIYGGAGT